MKWLSWIQIILGIWILIAPWILNYASLTPALWSNIISGAAVALTGLWWLVGVIPEEIGGSEKPHQ
ncbi:MAG TPA: SPW repeat protein [Candidatus Paceibacterota bacterium]